MRILAQELSAFKGLPAGQLWTAQPETMSRIRGRIESIIDWATAKNLRKGDEELWARVKARQQDVHVEVGRDLDGYALNRLHRPTFSVEWPADLRLLRRQLADRRVPTPGVVEALDIIEHVGSGFIAGPIDPAGDALGLQR